MTAPDPADTPQLQTEQQRPIAPPIQPSVEIFPTIYSWRTTDVPRYAGWEKIGGTRTQTADERIAQQASQLKINQEKLWERPARHATGEPFWDKDFHRYLRQCRVEQEERTEWFNLADAELESLEYFDNFTGHDYSNVGAVGNETYELRDEQEAAVQMALAQFAHGTPEVLWNAKPRFGKTLATYELARRLEARNVLIVTNRPAIANSWFDDYERFIGHATSYKFLSESDSLRDRTPMSRTEYVRFDSDDKRRIEFLSLQDLKGSKYFGGAFDKLKEVAEMSWDLLVVDEAHEGIDTFLTDVAFDKVKRTNTLHLSGTPFRALAQGKFGSDAIFNYSYADEQRRKAECSDLGDQNPYADLPVLNLLSYRLSPMIIDRIDRGATDDAADADYMFDLAEFFRTNESGKFVHEAAIHKWLKTLTENEKYPFSTKELRDEIRHSLWLLNRVDSAKALKRLLDDHPVFENYDIVLAAGDGRTNDDDPVSQGRSYAKVRQAIDEAEASGGKTITLSVGQLTTGVTVPEWTAVVMLSTMQSPAAYMQAAFRAQNPWTYTRASAAGKSPGVYSKKNAYIFDFAPERTLTVFDEFANNLRPTPTTDAGARHENVRELLNFFPVLGEDSEGRMVELDATQVLTFPQVFKAREVVRRGFMSNLLFENIGNIFRYSEQIQEILNKLPETKQGKFKGGKVIEMPDGPLEVDPDGTVTVDETLVIAPAIAQFGEPVYASSALPADLPAAPAREAARVVAKTMTEAVQETRNQLAETYGLTKSQVERDVKESEAQIIERVERTYADYGVAKAHLDDDRAAATTDAERAAVEQRAKALDAELTESVGRAVQEVMGGIVATVVRREERKREQTRADTTMDQVRSHLRGFARTIPMFLMAYGDRDLTLANLDAAVPEAVFQDVTGITIAEFRVLRDGQQVIEDDGTVTQIPGMFDAHVFDQSVQEFLNKKQELADYFDNSLDEDIFSYVPQQKTSLVFTPKQTVTQMVDILEAANPDIFSDKTKRFADLFSKAGMFLMELVRRLDRGLAEQIPDRDERLAHIFSQQIFALCPTEILRDITLEAVSGGDEARKKLLVDAANIRVGDLVSMPEDEVGAVGKFDVVIGNPPYQQEATGDATHTMPLYHRFMDLAYDIADKTVLVTPARFLFNAGYTPKAWNKKMLSDPHLTVPLFVANSAEVFPGPTITGGVAVTYRDRSRVNAPLGTFTRYPTLNSILHKVLDGSMLPLTDVGITSGRSYRYTEQMHTDHPGASRALSSGHKYVIGTNAFQKLPDLFARAKPDEEHLFTSVLGLDPKRVTRWIRREYVTGPLSLERFKVALPASRGAGGTLEDSRSARIVGDALVLGPHAAVTQTFITIGSFATEPEAESCLKYVKTKFARAMLGVLKVTQHNPAATWRYVPLQDFTEASDIDWTRSIAEIDAQLYAKYALTADQIDFIETHVKPMS